VLVSQASGYSLRLEGDRLDVYRFERLLEHARAAMTIGDLASAVSGLRAGLDLWRGPALSDFVAQPWAMAESARLNEMRLQTLEERLEAELALGRHAQLIAELEGLTTRHPLRERLRAHLMLALYRSGRQVDASEVYQKTRETLVDQAGMEPGLELQVLLKKILTHDPGLQLPATLTEGPIEMGASPSATLLATDAIKVVQTLGSAGPKLPQQLTSFVGRQEIMAEIRDLLDRSRLVTLTGAGGVGKTRLALEVSAGRIHADLNGVCLVELAAVEDVGGVADAMARALGLREQLSDSVAASLKRAIGERHLLLLVDNCERVVDGVAALADDLLQECPGVSILATSREPLGVEGEVIRRIPPLSVPDSAMGEDEVRRSDAMRLLMDRCSLHSPDRRFEGRDLEAAVEICQRLDGVPLALELAAAQSSIMPIQEVAAHIGQRFQLLVGRSRTAPRRHQTLRNAIDWSYEVLSDAESAVFRRVSTFSSNFTADGASYVAGGGVFSALEVASVLGSLVDKSLVILVADGYRLLETIREYARERLEESDEAAAIGQRHTAYFAALADLVDEELIGPDQGRWLAFIEDSLDDFRVALEQSLKYSPLQFCRLAAGLGWFWVRHRVAEGTKWVGQALEQPCGNRRLLSRILSVGCWLAFQRGDHATTLQLGQRLLEAARELNDPSLEGRAYTFLGAAHISANEIDIAWTSYETGESVLRNCGDEWNLSLLLSDLGLARHLLQQWPGSRAMVAEALELARRSGDRFRIGMVADSLATIELAEGAAVEARLHWRELLTEALKVGDRWTVPAFLEGEARLSLSAGEPQRCLLLLAAANAQRLRMGTIQTPMELDALAPIKTSAQAKLGAEASDEAWAAGSAMALENAVAVALETAGGPASA